MEPEKQTKRPSRKSIEMKLKPLGTMRASDIFKTLDETFSHFTTLEEKHLPKPIDLEAERERLKRFQAYLEEDKVVEKMSRGLGYMLWKRPCGYMNAMEAFRLNAYDEREGMAKIDGLREHRDQLRERYRQLFAEMIAQEVKTIRYKRMLRDDCYEPVVVAKSSGQQTNTYVHGYGYAYGIGYTDQCMTSTAPGFELVATDHVKRVIKAFSSKVGQGSFNRLYRDIFKVKNYDEVDTKRKSNVSFNLSNKYSPFSKT